MARNWSLTNYKVFPIFGKGYQLSDFCPINLSVNNKALYRRPDYQQLDNYIQSVLKDHNAIFAYGGYGEKRNLYEISDHFNSEDPRNIHLAVDIWGSVGSSIFLPIDGTIHSFAYNSQHLDYGYTLIMEHHIESQRFYTLYGHLAKETWQKGSFLKSGSLIAQIGNKNDNGGWPPHLHFQIIMDIGNWDGDYPGVSNKSESGYYLRNSPDPSSLIKFQ